MYAVVGGFLTGDTYISENNPIQKMNCVVNTPYNGWPRGDDSSLPVCLVSCTVHLQLFTNIDIL